MEGIDRENLLMPNKVYPFSIDEVCFDIVHLKKDGKTVGYMLRPKGSRAPKDEMYFLPKEKQER